MADYNVKMKQWNGTSFDNVLPLAYMANYAGNADKLEGKTYSDIQKYTSDYVAEYNGGEINHYVKSTNDVVSFSFPTVRKNPVVAVLMGTTGSNYNNGAIFGIAVDTGNSNTFTQYPLAIQNEYGYSYTYLMSVSFSSNKVTFDYVPGAENGCNFIVVIF